MRAARLVAVLGVLALLGGIWRVVSLVRGREWNMSGPDAPLGLQYLPQVTLYEQEGGELMTVLDLPAWLRALAVAPGLVESGALAVAAMVLMTVLMAIGQGHSFSDAVQLYLGRIATTLVASTVAVVVIDVVALWQIDVAISDHRSMARDAGETFDIVGFGTNPPAFPLMALALGLVAAALRWAFRDGARLEREVEGVV